MTEAGRVQSQVELLDALGHPWELEAAFQRRQVTERHSTHKTPYTDCDLCDVTPPARTPS